MSDWRSVNCWSGYHRQCASGKCTCKCHQPKPTEGKQ